MRIVSVALLFLAAGACTNAHRDAPLRSVIAFSSTRDSPDGDLLAATEIYLMLADGVEPRRLTNNADCDVFATPSPDGGRILFDSNRLRKTGEPRNVSDLFLMNLDGSEPVHLTRGSSGSWSPDGRSIAYHASASGAGPPVLPFPGAATTDSDIFVMNVEAVGSGARSAVNLTRNAAAVDDDPDWSPDGRTILFTSHAVTDNPMDATTAEIYVMPADGSGPPDRLTSNGEEERGPAWSPDGQRIVFCCRRGGVDFEICVMNADGSGQLQLTDNAVADLTATWSPDGTKIAFHRAVAGRATLELFVMNADGSGQAQLTDTPGQNAFPSWSEVRWPR